MDLESNLVPSRKGGWKASIASLVLHGGFIALIVVLSASATHKIAAQQPIRAFLAHEAAAPPPPPPPPPPAGHAKATPQVTKPIQVPKQTFVQPTQVPKEVPKVADADTTPAPSNDSQSDGVAGGVPGGVPGGVVGGVVGGQVGGVIGGQLGGVVGGVVGGTGTQVAPAPEPAKAPDGPLRVGGDVKAPTIEKRVEPTYSEMARKGRIEGVVILEAIINKDGDVEQVKVLKGLPFGLSDAAEEAVKQWHFKPGTLNGQPVDVIFNLTVNFKLNGS